MRFMNDYDIEIARRRFEAFSNLSTAVEALDSLRYWADSNSDGWAYWPKPCKAAARLMEVLEDPDLRNDWSNGILKDIDEKELKHLLAPIKTFLTKQGADWREVI